jgi:hypothetical protein
MEYEALPSKLNTVEVVHASGVCFIIVTGSDKYI